MTITTTAIQANQFILPEYACDGRNVNPPLTFSEIPMEAKSLVVLFDDPDAPGGMFTHWVLFGMSPATLQVPENGMPVTGKNGRNGYDKVGYNGPCPPPGQRHRYYFRLFALDIMVDLPEGVSRADVEHAIEGHVIDSAEIVGLYQKRSA